MTETSDVVEYDNEEAREALLDTGIAEEQGWTITAADFGGGPGIELTAPNGDKFIAIVQLDPLNFDDEAG